MQKMAVFHFNTTLYLQDNFQEPQENSQSFYLICCHSAAHICNINFSSEFMS